MKPLYLRVGSQRVAGIFEAPEMATKSTAVLIVPPFGWDEQTSYRPRRDWSRALVAAGFPCLRIDLPGTGDSSGDAREEQLVDIWAKAVAGGIEWLHKAGAARVAVIALGAGGLVTLKALAGGARIDDLVLWGMPPNGRSFLREFKAFGRFEQTQTGEPSADVPDGELFAGGHRLAPATIADVSALDPGTMLGSGHPRRALVMGRDGSGPDAALVEALRASGSAVSSDGGYGWGAALARPQSPSPWALFEKVNAWLAEAAATAQRPMQAIADDNAEMGRPGSRVRESGIVFHAAGQQLFGVVTEPADAPRGPVTVILYNAGAIRRIGPNRMWTEAARRWGAAGVPVLRVDVEGIGDAGGDGSGYAASDDPFYLPHLAEQARAVLDLAVQRGFADRFVLGGLCSGGYWAFQAALADERVDSVVMLNPRLLFFDPRSDRERELRKLGRLLTPAGIRRADLHKLTWKRGARLAVELLRYKRACSESIPDALRLLRARGQEVAMAFSGEEPLHDELRALLTAAELAALDVRIGELPYKSHTLKPLKAQQAGHRFLDEAIQRALQRCAGDQDYRCAIQGRSATRLLR